MSNYTVTHLHDMTSNCVTTIDSCTTYEQYIDRAKELDMKSIAFTNHGGLFEYIKRMQYCKDNGIRYIHAVEAYITENREEKIRDNLHVCLYALNYAGFLELNKIMSKAWNRNDNHFYFVPRLFMDEFLEISDNIAISSACLAGVLNRGTADGQKQFLQYYIQHRDRCFLEIQHHAVKDQIDYNKKLFELSKQYNLQLITGTDTHSLNADLAEARVVLQHSKNIYFENEDGWDLNFKSYDELIESYKNQNSVPMNIVINAIQNTNILADMVEQYDIDTTPKYPTKYSNPDKVFIEKITQGLKKHHKNSSDIYKKRVDEELETYKKTNSINYMLFMKDLVDYANKNDMWQGYGRGSVNGSLIAYLLGITNMDSIKYNLNFFRFLNPDRVSLPDIDTDWSNTDRDKIKEYLNNLEGLYSSEIITFNTIALKGAIRDVGRALEMPLAEVDEISKNVDINEIKLRQKYPNLFRLVDLVNGTIVSIGTHPSGVLVSPISLDDNVSLCTLSTTTHPVSVLNMKELDSLNYVKFDILGLDNVDVINRTCKLANIERLIPDNIDVDNMDVWKSLRDDATTIFQWESNLGQSYLKKIFSENTIQKLKRQNIKISMLDLLSFANGAIRPSGESFRDSAASGVLKDNGLQELNKFLESTLGYLTYQEQIMIFLVQFCGYSMAESDIVRRAIAKKKGTEDLLPEIEHRFVETSTKAYGITDERAHEIVKSFIKVIMDASLYGFSLNHSQPYSLIGYACAYLRYYYPLEYISSCLNVFQDNEDKTTAIIHYAKLHKIHIKPIKFRHSRSEYYMDKSDNSIYKGIESIKYCNKQIGEELYNIRNNHFDTFINLLIYLTENLSINSRQTETLIRLGFFDEFGGNQKLIKIYSVFQNSKIQYKKTYCEKTKIKRIAALREFESKVPDEKLSPKLQIEFENECLGMPESIFDIGRGTGYVMDVNTTYSPFIKIYGLSNGVIMEAKIQKKYFNKNEIGKGNFIKITNYERKAKCIGKDENGKWKYDPTEKVFWLTRYEKIIL